MTVRNTNKGFNMQFYTSICLEHAQIECEHVFYMQFASFCHSTTSLLVLIFSELFVDDDNCKRNLLTQVWHYYFCFGLSTMSGLFLPATSSGGRIAFRDLWGVKSPPNVTLVVWLVCHAWRRQELG